MNLFKLTLLSTGLLISLSLNSYAQQPAIDTGLVDAPASDLTNDDTADLEPQFPGDDSKLENAALEPSVPEVSTSPVISEAEEPQEKPMPKIESQPLQKKVKSAAEKLAEQKKTQKENKKSLAKLEQQKKQKETELKKLKEKIQASEKNTAAMKKQKTLAEKSLKETEKSRLALAAKVKKSEPLLVAQNKKPKSARLPASRK